MLRVLACLALAMFAGSAAAQTIDPVAEHERAYLAALSAGDSAAAETEAEAALAASEARDGDGGRTGELALTLASARLQSNDGAGALAAAQRAFALSERGIVNRASANLMLGRAEYATGAGPSRLAAALAPDMLPALPPKEIYPAASQWGLATFAAGEYATAESAWSLAAAYPSGSPHGEPYGRGMALALQAASIFYIEIGLNGRFRMDPTRGQEAFQLAEEAVRTLAPLARNLGADEPIPREVRGYAQALTVHTMIINKIASDGQRTDMRSDEQIRYVALENEVSSTCPVEFEIPYIPYPYASVIFGRIGVVAMLIRMREGRFVNANLVATIGARNFAVVTANADWDEVELEKADNAPAGCVMPTTIIVPIAFGYN